MSNQTSSLQSRERARSSSSTQNEEKDAAKLSFFRSIQLRLLNCGSVARDHLALERTYLAYVRTSLGLCSAGIALMQFLFVLDSTKHFAKPVGASMVLTGILTLILGTRRYFMIQGELVDGRFTSASIEATLITVFLGVVVAVTLVLVAWRH